MSTPAAATDSEVLLEEDGFLYLDANEVPRESVVALLSESFSREPMARALGASARDLAPFCQALHARMHEQRTLGRRGKR